MERTQMVINIADKLRRVVPVARINFETLAGTLVDFVLDNRELQGAEQLAILRGEEIVRQTKLAREVNLGIVTMTATMLEVRTERDTLRTQVAELEALAESTIVYLRDLDDNIMRNDVDIQMDSCKSPSYVADTLASAITKKEGA